jgi:hypothetical protein
MRQAVPNSAFGLGNLCGEPAFQKAEKSLLKEHSGENTQGSPGHEDQAKNAKKPVTLHFSNKKICRRLKSADEMADREGFEPPVPAKVRLISSQVH